MMSATDAVRQLNAIRLRRHWSFDELVTDMRRKGALVKRSTIFRLIHEQRHGRQPQETTLYQISLYLDRVRSSSSSPKRRSA